LTSYTLLLSFTLVKNTARVLFFSKTVIHSPHRRDKVNLSYLLRMALSIVSDLLNDITGAFAGNGHMLKPDNAIVSLERALTGVTSARAISDATFQKATDTVIDTQILTLSESADRLRERNNAKSLAQSFDSISEDNRLISKPFRGRFSPLSLKISGVEAKLVE
jgi:hypothetical protein